LLHPRETRAHTAGETLKVWNDLPDDEKQAVKADLDRHLGDALKAALNSCNK
jgi:hypothetical protein